jgi:hypothetical protein
MDIKTWGTMGFISKLWKTRNWDSTVAIVMGYKLDKWGLIPGRGRRFFSSPQYADGTVTQPASCPMGNRLIPSG